MVKRKNTKSRPAKWTHMWLLVKEKHKFCLFLGARKKPRKRVTSWNWFQKFFGFAKNKKGRIVAKLFYKIFWVRQKQKREHRCKIGLKNFLGSPKTKRKQSLQNCFQKFVGLVHPVLIQGRHVEIPAPNYLLEDRRLDCPTPISSHNSMKTHTSVANVTRQRTQIPKTKKVDCKNHPKTPRRGQKTPNIPPTWQKKIKIKFDI